MLSALAFLSLTGWLYLAFFHGRFFQILEEDAAPAPSLWPSVDIVVPARNEADMLKQTLPALLAQTYGGAWRIILVDDHSTDGTETVAHNLAAGADRSERLLVLRAPELEAGWTGKLAAMAHGAKNCIADYILFTDADILHDPDSLSRLAARAKAQDIDLVSLMVKLRCVSLAEKLMIPAFVFFFAALYPFSRANNPNSKVAAAAGGVMLVRRKALEAAGGLAEIKTALIDDCALADLMKKTGRKTRLTLTRNVHSLRPYPTFRAIHDMVARTAFTQLRHSLAFLVLCVMGLFMLFIVPAAALAGGTVEAAVLGTLALYEMLVLYRPMTRFYGLGRLWTTGLPFAALLYLIATLDSARRYWQGRGGQWKGRAQAA